MDKIIVDNCSNCIFLHELHSDYFCKLSKNSITFKELYTTNGSNFNCIVPSEIPSWCELRSGVIKVGLKP